MMPPTTWLFQQSLTTTKTIQVTIIQKKVILFFTLLFMFETMHFMIVSFQLGHINENGNNITVIPEMEGREKDTNTTVSNLTMTHLKKILLHFLGVVCFNSPLLNLTRVDVMVVLLIFAFSSFKIICPSSGHCPECRLQISFE